jgi:methylated-DNA-[protein]-cysteine S-methyltransferase
VAVLRLATPIGELTLVASDTALMAVHFPTPRSVASPGGEVTPLLARVRQQLEEYFARIRTSFDLPLDPVGSEFQRRVWDALRAIPYGTTVSYSDIARRLGDARATRAVGAANGQNPIPIIVPCHRVIGADGDLTGFGGGIERKRWLLEHEGALLQLGG